MIHALCSGGLFFSVLKGFTSGLSEESLAGSRIDTARLERALRSLKVSFADYESPTAPEYASKYQICSSTWDALQRLNIQYRNAASIICVGALFSSVLPHVGYTPLYNAMDDQASER